MGLQPIDGRIICDFNVPIGVRLTCGSCGASEIFPSESINHRVEARQTPVSPKTLLSSQDAEWDATLELETHYVRMITIDSRCFDELLTDWREYHDELSQKHLFVCPECVKKIEEGK